MNRDSNPSEQFLIIISRTYYDIKILFFVVFEKLTVDPLKVKCGVTNSRELYVESNFK